MSIAGKKVVITAGASGLGRAMAEAFHAGGAKVWIADVDEEAVADCPDDWGRSAFDVSDETAFARFFENEVRTELGGLDIICANAGVSGPAAAVEDIALEDWQRCLAVNLDGAFLAAKYASPMMKAQGSGLMLLTSSTAGLFGYPNRTPYAAAKWGIIGLMKSLAMELGPHGIRVNAICPGAVEGPRMDGVIAREAALGRPEDEVRAGYVAGTSMRSFVQASDIASMAVYLGSDAGRFISGQAIAIDGHTETTRV